MTKITSLPEATTITNAATLIVVDQGVTKRISYETFRSTGLKGDTGSIGPQGPIGLRGPTGTVATIAVGTVLVDEELTVPTITAVTTATTASAVVTFLDFVFPLGPKGDTGTFTLGIATTTTLGGVKIGSGIAIDEGGKISATPPEVEPATVFSIGGVIIGDGIDVESDGTISVNTGTPYVLPTASNSTLGGVRIGAGVNITNGVISVTTGAFALQTATSVILGGVKIGSGIDVTSSGTISVTVNTATDTVVGGVKIGLGIDISSSGTISVNPGVSDAGALTGSTLASNITTSSLTTLGTLDGLTVQGTTTLYQTLEVYRTFGVGQAYTGTTILHNLTTGNVFIHNNASANWTANFTFVSSIANRTVSVAVLVNQGPTPYLPLNIEINSVPQTINWQGGVTPTGNANKKDLITFTFITGASVSTSTYTVLGSLTSFG
jgi:hypothetical protein